MTIKEENERVYFTISKELSAKIKKVVTIKKKYTPNYNKNDFLKDLINEKLSNSSKFIDEQILRLEEHKALLLVRKKYLEDKNV